MSKGAGGYQEGAAAVKQVHARELWDLVWGAENLQAVEVHVAGG